MSEIESAAELAPPPASLSPESPSTISTSASPFALALHKDRFDQDAIRVVQRLRDFKHQAYVVGGCVRDLLLNRKPKDFDVATSATPQDLKRIFRNCRIIGRRFRLAHIFFPGNKIIETSTFRANPREGDDEALPVAENAPPSRNDLLIRRDNVFGTELEDAVRRDFTINGLFFDIEKNEVIDHVGGLPDLEARLVRTIGDPDVRFREDPVRILRAVKFAARCNLQIEAGTYQSIIRNAAEVQKSAQARVSEEFFRLLRAGAAHRSVELLKETGLLQLLLPELNKVLDADSDSVATGKAPWNPPLTVVRDRAWEYLAALDRWTTRKDTAPSNALVLGVLLMPALRELLHPGTKGTGDLFQLLTRETHAVLTRLRASRKDGEQAQMILLAMRYALSTEPGAPKPRTEDREFFPDIVALQEILADIDAAKPELAAQAFVGESSDDGDDANIRRLETLNSFERMRLRRDRRGERPGPNMGFENGNAAGPYVGGMAPTAPQMGGRDPHRRPPPSIAFEIPRNGALYPIPDLATLGPLPELEFPYLGRGAFGSRWGLSGD